MVFIVLLVVLVLPPLLLDGVLVGGIIDGVQLNRLGAQLAILFGRGALSAIIAVLIIQTQVVWRRPTRLPSKLVDE